MSLAFRRRTIDLVCPSSPASCHRPSSKLRQLAAKCLHCVLMTAAGHGLIASSVSQEFTSNPRRITRGEDRGYRPRNHRRPDGVKNKQNPVCEGSRWSRFRSRDLLRSSSVKAGSRSRFVPSDARQIHRLRTSCLTTLLRSELRVSTFSIISTVTQTHKGLTL